MIKGSDPARSQEREERLLVGDEAVVPYADLIRIPATPMLLQPLVAMVSLQVFACELGAARGNEVDQPRNLVKSVIVEYASPFRASMKVVKAPVGKERAALAGAFESRMAMWVWRCATSTQASPWPPPE
ncbi:hypothetical protein GCM10020367_44340 [Streptomyces sannanensis]|uniref:Uncharacterized protein n=1 Tax=Streptomyces sannanensis TaxID=285536 RepID=A0ABP6SFK8_9ACTN